MTKQKYEEKKRMGFRFYSVFATEDEINEVKKFFKQLREQTKKSKLSIT